MVETRGTTRKGGKPEPLKSPTAEKINRDAISRLGPPGIRSPKVKKTTTKKGKPPTYPKDINDDLDKIFGGSNDDMQESIEKIVNEAKQNPQGSPSAGTRSKITIKLTVGEASAAKQKKKRKKEEEAAAAKKKTAKEAANAKKQANAASAAAKKKAKEEAAVAKRKEKEEAAAAKKKAKAEAAAAKKTGKPGVTKKAAKSKAPAKTAASTRKTRSRKNLAEPARTSPLPVSSKANTASQKVKKNPPTNKEPAKGKPTKRTRTNKVATTAPKESKKAATAKKQAGQGKAPAKTVAKPTGVTKTRSTRSSARDAPNKTARVQPSYELQRGFAPTESQRRMIGFAIRSREWFTELERDYGTEFMKEVLNDKRIPHVDFWNRAFRFLGATAVGRSRCLGKPYET
ncbi:hypothetical protein CLCR_03537 [Cladophialophora carrionii]|uniref:Uncharacterized protein n=1 Tax=Cladophialophora carrionii TaxID=86049 RepID=A0A1C1CFW0_9EURO|nr:hypothetical protein CLCR_03537 [Cladophialophora carrionii]